jgi:hypothetical protein
MRQEGGVGRGGVSRGRGTEFEVEDEVEYDFRNERSIWDIGIIESLERLVSSCHSPEASSLTLALALTLPSVRRMRRF